MRTTVDIADGTYAPLKARAARERTSVKALISYAVETLLDHAKDTRRTKRKMNLPLVGSSAPGTLNISDETIYEYLDA